MSTTITSRDRLIDILSLSYLGDLLREQLGSDAENYTWPDDFEKAVADLGFRALSVVGEPPVFDKLVCIGDGLILLPRANASSNTRANFETVQFIAPTLTEIPERCFERMIMLDRITIPDSVTSIGASAFYGCTGLTSVVIPDSVTSIGASAFYGCTGLTSLRVPKAATYPSSNNAWLYNNTSLHTLGSEDSETDYDIKLASGIQSIGGYAFQGCTGLTSVVIPDSVTSIGTSAFQGCTGLTSVVIPDSVTSIGTSAFQGCTGLTSVVIPDSVTSIGAYAFQGCTGLTGTVTMNGLATYSGGNGNGAFHSCRSMTSFSAPKIASITSGTNAQYGFFYGCSGMTVCNLGSVGYPVTSIQNVTFSGCTNTSLVVTVYTNSQNVASVLANVRNGATNATIIIKAAADMEYNGTTYSAGDTVLTSTP